MLCVLFHKGQRSNFGNIIIAMNVCVIDDTHLLFVFCIVHVVVLNIKTCSFFLSVLFGKNFVFIKNHPKIETKKDGGDW